MGPSVNNLVPAIQDGNLTSTTNQAGVRDPHAHSGHRRAHTLLGTVEVMLTIPKMENRFIDTQGWL